MNKDYILKAVAETEGKLAALREEIIDFTNKNPSIFDAMLFSYSLMPIKKLSDIEEVEPSTMKIAALSDALAYGYMLSIILEKHGRLEDEDMDN